MTRVLKTAFLFLLYAGSIHASVKLPVVFSDNMVLQRSSMASLWGKCDPGSTVQILTSWNKKKYLIKAGHDGSFRLKVGTAEAGGPFTIRFTQGTTIVLHNVMLGEVWLCSGQSNMEMPLAGWGKIQNYEAEIAAAKYPSIRLLQVKKAISYVVTDTLAADGGGWQVCSPATIQNFSAVAYFFARALYKDKHIAVGLIHTSWGGTVAEAWTSAASLRTTPAFAERLKELQLKGNLDGKANGDKHVTDYPAKLKTYMAQVRSRDSGYRGDSAAFASPSYNDHSWKKMQQPGLWEASGLAGYDGIVWFRKKIVVKPNWLGKDLQLSLGTIDDDDITWYNGVEVGRTEGYAKPRLYTVPAALVKPGEAVITVRVTDNGGGGGFYGDAAKMSVSPTPRGENATSLTGAWSYFTSVSFASMPPAPPKPNDPNQVTVLYNAMIYPLLGFGIRGAIWYQGESNADRAYQYQTLFPLMITDWRKHWGLGSFPFLYVQLANFGERKDTPAESNWAELREAQLKTLSLPGTSMAVIIDIGEDADIHPKNKQEVGRRLALLARAHVYKEPVVCSGPVFESLTTSGHTAFVKFSHADSGLVTHGASALQGFAVAGEDHKFHWANAQISGNVVQCSAVEVPKPVAVRYGWANSPICNLYNGAGLPASPFRTDAFTEITRDKQ